MEHFRDNGSRSCLETKEMEDNIASSLSRKRRAEWRWKARRNGKIGENLAEWKIAHSLDDYENDYFHFCIPSIMSFGRKMCLHLSRKCDFKKYTEVFF